ncbi:MAG: spermidine/putrescine ABC transporter substrate-binding protein [Anaerolineales bacterium]|nr:spermidine/putrescine ABC transporter substrate-binding protein [Anaerolineales bacterium]
MRKPFHCNLLQHKPLRYLILVLWSIFALFWLSGCGTPTPPPTPTPPKLVEELIFYNWEDDMPQAVLDAFTTEYGVKVTYLTYDTSEEATANIKSGQVAYDIAVIEHDYVPSLVADGLLAQVNYRHVLNFKNISPNFRDLTFDPNNKHLIPYTWGSTGLIIRSDLVEKPVTRWADLWAKRYAGRIAVRPEPSELITIALKSLGYRVNTEDPAALEAALQHLLELKPSLTFVETETEGALAGLLSGEAVILVGWPGDALAAQSRNPAITYVLPEEGTFLWGDGFVISANSPNKDTAELFLNFLLRPEINAQIVNEYHYATANEAAYPFINPDIRNNPIVFPPIEDIEKGEWYLPLSPDGQKLYDQVWQHFMNAATTEKK